MRLVKKLAPNVIWTMTGTVFNQGSTLVSNVWIANELGKLLFGEFAIVLATVQATVSVASLGVGYTTTRYLAEWTHRDPARAAKLLALFSRLSWVASFAAAFLLAVGAPGIAKGALDAPSVGQPLLITAVAALFNVRNGFLTGALQGLDAFKRVGISGVISGIAYLALTAVGARLDGVRGAAVGLLIAAAVQCAVLTFALHRERIVQRIAQVAPEIRSELPLIFKFALPGALSPISTVPVLWAVQALIVRSDNGFADLAAYAAGLNLLTIAMFPPTMLLGVAMVYINRTFALEGDAGFRSALRMNAAITVVLALGTLLFVALLTPTILGLYGKDFRTGYLAIGLLLAAVIPESLTNALYQSLGTRERMWEAVLGVNVPRDLTIMALAWVLVPRMGVVGAATSYLVGRVVALLTTTFLVRHELLPQRRSAPIEAIPEAVQAK